MSSLVKKIIESRQRHQHGQNERWEKHYVQPSPRCTWTLGNNTDDAAVDPERRVSVIIGAGTTASTRKHRGKSGKFDYTKVKQFLMVKVTTEKIKAKQWADPQFL